MNTAGFRLKSMLAAMLTMLTAAMAALPVPLPPGISDRAYWEKIRPDAAAEIIKAADEILAKPVTPASFRSYLQGGITGDTNSHLMNCASPRRSNMLILTLAACASGDSGKYIDKIIDYLWEISEETYWCSYTSSKCAGQGDPMVDELTEIRTDLVSAATAADMALTLHILEDDLNAVSPRMVKHLKAVAAERSIGSVLDKRTGAINWWLNPKIAPNNWTPWCSMNCLTAALICEPDELRVRAMLEKCDRQIRLYIDNYPEDGFCEEGPDYWSLGCVTLVYYLGLRERYFPDAPPLITGEKLRCMAEYICAVRITPEYTASYADAGSRCDCSPAMLHTLAEATGSKLLSAYGDYAQLAPASCDALTRHGLAMLPLITMRELRDEKRPEGKAPELPHRTDFSGHLAIIRNPDGFSVSLKGGSNAEPHNHNDLGHFTVYYRNEPLILDTGRGEYCQDTFMPEKRYGFRHIGASGHNAPEIDGVCQQYGAEYRAEVKTDGDILSVELKDAYPAEAGLNGFSREVSVAEQSVTVTDRIGKDGLKEVRLRLFSMHPAEISGNKVKFGNGAEMESHGIVPVKISEYRTDAVMKANYADPLYCIELTGNGAEYRMEFRPRKDD